MFIKKTFRGGEVGHCHQILEAIDIALLTELKSSSLRLHPSSFIL